MSSIQPQWQTQSGSLGTIPERVFYQIPLTATAGDQDVFFALIAGSLPSGIQVTSRGMIEGIPRNIVTVQGVPTEVSQDITSRFAIRAYTQRVINGRNVIDRLADRTFEITVTGQSLPEFVTPPGRVGTFYDGTKASVQIEFTDSDLDDQVTIRVASGELPPGLELDARTGLISGVILPLVGPPDTAQPGYDTTPYDEYPYDFTLRASSKNYQFTLAITDGKESNLRTFAIYVYAKDQMSADDTDITADDTFVTADVTTDRPPLLLTTAGDLGRIRADNYFAFKFDGIDFDGEAIEYITDIGGGIGFDTTGFDETNSGFDQGAFALPPGLQLESDTGWLYGYIPDQGATEFSYTFPIVVRNVANPAIQSAPSFFTMTVIGDIETQVIWLTPSDLGTIDNGAISELAVAAFNVGGRALQYRLAAGTNSKLPQGLTLLPSGNIVGRVSFNTFALDGGATRFDSDLITRLTDAETTFDLSFQFTVNAFAAESQQITYGVGDIIMTSGGSGYTTQPTITISEPDDTADSIQATAGVATITDGVITSIALGNPGRGYTTAPTITITGGGGSGASAITVLREVTVVNPVSVLRTFTVTVARRFNQPYETLYIKAMPPQNDRDIVSDIVQDQTAIPQNLVYRSDDPNFGVAKSVIYNHAYGLTASTLADYVSALQLNHYNKNLVLGPLRTAQATDANGTVIYEVVYSEIIDNLVNNQGESVGKEVTLPYAVQDPLDVSSLVTEVYPNSLDNMRDQVIDTVGQISPALPRWMTSKQANGTVLGFRPAWVIAYVKPGNSGRIAYNLDRAFGDQLNIIDFEVDRYILDRSQTRNWDAESDNWIPTPPAATTFDRAETSFGFVSWLDQTAQAINWVNEDADAVRWNNFASGVSFVGTIFDGGSTTFIAPADRWIPGDSFDKYLLFPKVNILG